MQMQLKLDMKINEQGDDTRPVYIAGPMRGYDYFNFPAFTAAERHLRKCGFLVVMNPAARDLRRGFDPTLSLEENDFDMREALGFDVDWIARNCKVLYMLDGWEKSKGATAEHALGLALGLTILYQTKPATFVDVFRTEEYKIGYDYGYKDGRDDAYNSEDS